MKNKIILAIAVLFIAIQFIRIDKNNPVVKVEEDIISILKPSESGF